MFFTILVSPDECDPPHKISHEDKYIELANEFVENGWGSSYPPLVGYEFCGRIQLLTGSHRWAAAKLAGIQIPIKILSYNQVQAANGDLLEWERILATE